MDKRIDELATRATEALLRWVEEHPVMARDGQHVMEWHDGRAVALDVLAAIAELRRHQGPALD